jgi:hypothetical protein
MMKPRVHTGLIFASWALLAIFGCHKKKPTIPPEQTPPTIISQVPTEPTAPPADQKAEQSNAGQEPADNTPAEKPTHKPPKHPRTHTPPSQKSPDETGKTASAEEAKNIPPPRVVIQEGGVKNGTGPVAAGAVNNSSGTGQATTQQLLDSTENNLHSLKRQLSADEESMLAQIRDYIKQSKDAIKDGDNPRAHNLALKARLLSDELVKGQ